MKNLIIISLLLLYSCTELLAQTQTQEQTQTQIPTIRYNLANFREGTNEVYNNPANGKALVAVVRNATLVSWQVMQGTNVLATFNPVQQTNEPPKPEPEPEPQPNPTPKPNPSLPPTGTKLEGTQKENIYPPKDQSLFIEILTGATMETKCESGTCIVVGDKALQFLQ